MRKKGDKKKEYFLDHAWRIAFDSMTFDVTSNSGHSNEILLEAKSFIQSISKTNWWPIAHRLYDEGEQYDSHALAEAASTLFINKKMETTGLIVTSGGDY